MAQLTSHANTTVIRVNSKIQKRHSKYAPYKLDALVVVGEAVQEGIAVRKKNSADQLNKSWRHLGLPIELKNKRATLSWISGRKAFE